MIIYSAKINGKPYIGQTSFPLGKRISKHKWTAARDPKDYFHHAIRKYGIENCEWEVLCECFSKEELNIMETFMIMVHHSHVSEGGYNLSWGGEGRGWGYKHTEKTKRKMRKPKPIGFGDRVSFALTGRKSSEETIRKAVETRRKNDSYKHTEEQKRRTAETRERNGINIQHSEKMSKKWIVINPGKESIEILNLHKFCNENNLHNGHMCAVAHGKLKQYKGWKCKCA